jgi:rod shape-determining protein MreD
MRYQSQKTLDIWKIFNILLVVVSVAVCSILMLVNIPGVELLETNPNWLLIWLVSWSVQRTVGQSAIAGLAIGWIYDGITISAPSHVLSFVVVAVVTSSLQKQKYLGEDFISIALVVFFMSILSEAIYAVQYTIQYFGSVTIAIAQYQQIAIISAIITSIWSPAFYYPFKLISNKIESPARRM